MIEGKVPVKFRTFDLQLCNHLCQQTDRVYGSLELKGSMVTSCQLPMEGQNFHWHFGDFAVCFKGVRKIWKYFC